LYFVIKVLPQQQANYHNYHLLALNLNLSREEIVDCMRETRIR